MHTHNGVSGSQGKLWVLVSPTFMWVPVTELVWPGFCDKCYFALTGLLFIDIFFLVLFLPF